MHDTARARAAIPIRDAAMMNIWVMAAGREEKERLSLRESQGKHEKKDDGGRGTYISGKRKEKKEKRRRTSRPTGIVCVCEVSVPGSRELRRY